ncbi:toll-like receptor 2 type-2 [Haliotis rubra]|uniref:toll-like receptor 2 type-2 n=1 Tax=Haliotis rubra TaxID=36100 RepID=UPI001EE5548D|nr:toll-like receptor 2 type-2 [Haliotis rubra]
MATTPSASIEDYALPRDLFHLLEQERGTTSSFSYEISDREWVEEVTRRLESPEMGFRCSMHERDFHGGKRIIENITEHIRLSEKTVLVLSPDFIQSHWCMFEIEMGMILSMEESQLLVVPVMVKRCFVPDSIKTLTYIDATPGNDWWQRFIGAIVCKGV